ncbi:MAG: HipA N-terminal domain-containing protein [Cyclobacteriaceae bacterium]|nr:HipA N-terminal domain-containing protein [Cyclobacteriaceae bacterium]MCX7637598.1 HipA N-terminal domain-containing protein [Cyclobacteriaceae bacterium]MDW8330726.1 HipA N-terminal domain-containing protein [Cyclobacteriaceae bacterium]
MRKAEIYMHDVLAGRLLEMEDHSYVFEYDATYAGEPVSLTMPVNQRRFNFDKFPAFFEGLLPEGVHLEALLRMRKLDRYDYMGQLLATGKDMVGAVTVKEIKA